MVAGIVLLYFGGDLLVKNAVALARQLGVSSLVIGLTVVAFGTSAPELAATLASALGGVPEIAIGNIVGSNTANIGLILGLTALVYPLQGSALFVRREVPITILVGAFLVPLLWDGVVSRLEGALLLILLSGYLGFLFRKGEEPEEEADAQRPVWQALLLIGLGVLLLVGGARALVTGAVTIAQALGVPEKVIGLTLVAFGTSLPELASSVIAALKRETDIILGNIVGSNLFNVLAVLGTTALVTPVPQVFAEIRPDIIVMIAFSVVVLPLMLRRSRLGRVGGAVLFAGYLVYIGYLFV